MLGIVAGCKSQATYERWFGENGLEYKTVRCLDDANNVDAMIFCGGPDVGVNAERDALEKKVFDYCRLNGIPIWGGCRGMQMVSYCLGAELINDLGEDGNARHRAEGEPGHKISKFHFINISDGRSLRTNSRHHQAVKDAPFKCRLDARSDDEVWELMVSADDRYFLVQSHPEMVEMRGSDISRMCMDWIKNKVKSNMELLKRFYGINSKSGNEAGVKAVVKEQLSDLKLDIKEDFFGNLFITKGVADSYPCLAAHMDEVHFPSVRNIKDEDGVIYAVDDAGERVGIGADDKNGVWMIIKLLHEVDTLKVALFVQEEKDGDISGCRGSNACSLEFFTDCRYIVECDRKGCSDVVTFSEKAATRLCEDDFIPKELLDKFCYEVVNGGKTDVTALKMRGLRIPCCNISCGYYNAHHADEYTVTAELLNALGFVKSVICTL